MKSALLILLVAATAALAQPSLINHTSAQAASNPSSPSIDMRGASFIAGCASTATSNPSISDSNGNTYTTTTLATGGPYVFGFYSVNPTVSASMNWTFSGSVANFEVAGWSNVATSSPYDSTAGIISSTATNATQAGGPITPSQNNSLIISCTGANPSGATYTLTINSGFSITDWSTYTSGCCFGGGMAYLVQSTAATVNPTWVYQTVNVIGGAFNWVFKGTLAAIPSKIHHVITGGEL